MTTVNRSFVIAVFKNNNQAQQAMQDLMKNGFNRDQIRYSVRQGGGGIDDDLVNMGIPRQEADFYNHEFEQGNTVVTVHTNNRQQEALNILKKDGGYDFNINQGQETNYATRAGGAVPPTGRPVNAASGPFANATTANASNVAANAPAPNAPNAPNAPAPNAANVAANAPNAPNTANVPGTAQSEREIEPRTKESQPETRWVKAGEVEITKKVVSNQETVDVPVTREEVVIERHPVSGEQVSNTSIPANENETIRVPVSGEKVDVENLNPQNPQQNPQQNPKKS